MATTKILGFVETHNQCDCCGKTGLKGTYVVLTENGDIYHMGSRCVMVREGFTKEKEIKESIKTYQSEVVINARERFRELGGYDIAEKMIPAEWDTPEQMELYSKWDEIRQIVLSEFRTEHVKHITF